MKKFFTRFFFLSVVVLLFAANVQAQFPTIYATVASGTWNTAGTSPQPTIWETFTGNATNTPGAQGTGTPYTGPASPGAINGPSGTHFVVIRSGHTVTMNSAGRSCYGMLIEAGGKLWANETTDRRLQLVNGGTGFTYPQSSTITNNGEMGGPNDGLYFEPGTNCENVTITGTGTTAVRMLRVGGGLGGGAGIVNITIDKNISFSRTNNYALSLIYNPQPTNNFSLTINAGKTVTLTNASGYFSNNSIGSGGGFGQYTYNINGTLDLTASTQTMDYLTAFSIDGGTVNLNVGSTGVIKTGAAFNSSPVAPGVANLNLANGAIIDATLAQVMNFNANAFQVTGTGAVVRTVSGVGVRSEFPLGIGGSYNPLIISHESGPAEVYTAGLTNAPIVPPPALTLPRAWGISETTAGGNVDTLRFGFTTADIGGSGFDPSQQVYVGGWDGTKWVTVPATMSGTGDLATPYFARAVGTFVSTVYILTNTNTTTPVTLVNMKAAKSGSGIQVEFANATELDVKEYVIEKSADGRNFITLTTLSPKTNNGTLNSYAYADVNPYRGNNSYRIKAIEKNGNVKYSIIISLNLDRTATNVNVYPNPVKGNSISIQLENISKGVYTVVLYNGVGQKVFTKQMKHDGNTSTLVTALPPSVKTGIYRLQVSNGSNQYLRNIIVE